MCTQKEAQTVITKILNERQLTLEASCLLHLVKVLQYDAHINQSSTDLEVLAIPIINGYIHGVVT